MFEYLVDKTYAADVFVIGIEMSHHLKNCIELYSFKYLDLVFVNIETGITSEFPVAFAQPVVEAVNT